MPLFFLFIIFCQIIIGAFVSGMDAGQIYNSWPLMGSSYFPDDNSSFQERSDATLIILNSNYQEAGTIKFRDLFPTELTGIPFDATIEQQQYYTATAIFKYTMYDLIDNDGKKV